MPLIDPSDPVGRFLLFTDEDGQRLRSNASKVLDDQEGYLKSNHAREEFMRTYNDDTAEEIMSYNEILDHPQNQEDEDQIEWLFKRVSSHHGPDDRSRFCSRTDDTR